MIKVKRVKQLVVLGLIVSLTSTTMLTGCKGKDANVDTAGEEVKTSSEIVESSTEKKASTEPEKITIGIKSYAFVTDFENNYQTQLLEEKFNVDIEILQLPADEADYKTKLSLMVTSGQDLPDIIASGVGDDLAMDSGVFIPLNDYLDNSETTKYFNEIPAEDRNKMLSAMTSVDGNIYGLGSYEPDAWNLTPNRTYINKTWLDTLGLEVPTTTDELYTVLQAFATQDPNGNGIADEIPAYGYVGWYGQNIAKTLMNSFVFYNGHQQSEGLALSDDGKTVIAPFATDGWYDGLEYMNKLCSEGLLASSLFTDDDTQYKAILNNEINIVGFISTGSIGAWTDVENNANFQEMTMIAPLKGPTGLAYTPTSSYTPSRYWSITTSAKNPELCVKMGDYCYEPEMSLTVRYGEKGVDWTDDAEVCSTLKNLYTETGLIDGIKVAIYNNVWVQNSTKIWHCAQPRYVPEDFGFGVTVIGDKEYDPNSKTVIIGPQNTEWYTPAHPENLLPGLTFNATEVEELGTVGSDVYEYVTQNMGLFITGARSLSEWDEYLKELDEIGLSILLKNAQSAYERTKID